MPIIRFMNQDVKILDSTNVANVLDTLNIRQRNYVLGATLGRLPKASAAFNAGFENPPQSLAVRNAISVIQTEMAKELEVDVQHVAVGLQDAIEMARMKGEPMTMIAGYREQAKLAGLYVERKEIDITHRRVFTQEEIMEMEDEDLAALIEQADAIELAPNEDGSYG